MRSVICNWACRIWLTRKTCLSLLFWLYSCMANHRHCLMFGSENSMSVNGLKSFNTLLVGYALATRATGMVTKSKDSAQGALMVSESLEGCRRCLIGFWDLTVAGVAAPAALLQRRIS